MYVINHCHPTVLTLLAVDRLASLEWRVDYLLSSSALQELNAPSVQLKLNINPADGGAIKSHSFDVSSAKFRVLLSGKNWKE